MPFQVCAHFPMSYPQTLCLSRFVHTFQWLTPKPYAFPCFDNNSSNNIFKIAHLKGHINGGTLQGQVLWPKDSLHLHNKTLCRKIPSQIGKVPHLDPPVSVQAVEPRCLLSLLFYFSASHHNPPHLGLSVVNKATAALVQLLWWEKEEWVEVTMLQENIISQWDQSELSIFFFIPNSENTEAKFIYVLSRSISKCTLSTCTFQLLQEPVLFLPAVKKNNRSMPAKFLGWIWKPNLKALKEKLTY